MTAISKMLEMAKAVQKKAYVPFSNFHVGACILSSSGKFYQGCNVENASFSLTLCAEASAIASMVSDGDQKIEEILIIGSDFGQYCFPCGACRQRIAEFSDENTLIHASKQNGEVETLHLSQLLPRAFTLKSTS